MLRSPLRAASAMHSDVLTRRLFTSPAALPLPLPSPRETHFWYVLPSEVKDISLLNQYQELLSPCERQNILSMKEDKLQKHALLSRALVRVTVARWPLTSISYGGQTGGPYIMLDTDCKMSPSSLQFQKNKFGKPEVEWQNDDTWVPPSLHFNVSHTSSLIACGVTLDMQIGIDVEEKERKPNNTILSVARRYFSPNEVEFLNTISDPECQRREFIKLWTLKESYVKALGRGLAGAPLKNFTIRFEASRVQQVSRDRKPDGCHQPFPKEIASNIVIDVSESGNLTSNWQFALFELDTHYAAVCVERDRSIEGGPSDPLKLKVWKTLPLVEDELVSETDTTTDIAVLP